ncbi:hypothetical protein DPMN_146867 [Dreissena polymorpha]|uniref:Uncharacterized protein n=1 Tax=Dreissena polymorpha TaxID=45954 RepID=A0A9D4F6M6_DREPO|nr:hypothetical protein DPMN_146867 [Dreissena polymorpha]
MSDHGHSEVFTLIYGRGRIVSGDIENKFHTQNNRRTFAIFTCTYAEIGVK